MKIGYIPLDERPVNTRYPKMVAEIANAELLLPPSEILSDFRTSAQSGALVEWLNRYGTECDVIVASCETLGYGSLIQSRISHEAAGTIIGRLETLRALRQRKPALRIFGFNLITRISRSNDATEEPDYWAEHGAGMYLYSQLLDRAQQGQAVDDELRKLRAQLPDEYVNDFLARRLRNHIVNLAAVQMLADSVFDLLVLSSDDTSPYGLGSREKRWIGEWAARLGLEKNLLMYPGADEVGSVLVARAINEHFGKIPTFEIAYVVPEGAGITAAFEDSAVSVTVERQIRAAGGVITDDRADILLMVNPPRSSEMSWPLPYSDEELQRRSPDFLKANTRIAENLDAGRMVAAADVAHANGADGAWVDSLQQAGLFKRLDAYSAWNTAGNSIGTTVAEACIASQFGRDTAAQKKFLAHRLIEDWAYQCVVRDQINLWIYEQTGAYPLPADLVASAAQRIEAALGDVIRQHLPELNYEIVPGSIHLPWRRTFEIDFDLQPA